MGEFQELKSKSTTKYTSKASFDVTSVGALNTLVSTHVPTSDGLLQKPKPSTNQTVKATKINNFKSMKPNNGSHAKNRNHSNANGKFTLKGTLIIDQENDQAYYSVSLQGIFFRFKEQRRKQEHLAAVKSDLDASEINIASVRKPLCTLKILLLAVIYFYTCCGTH
jgi:hypothetical protein